MIGVELGYTYADSGLIAYEPGNFEDWDTITYTPHARPGVRIPHVWLRDGRAMQDVLGPDYVLLDLTGNADTSAVAAAFNRAGAPLQVFHSDERDARAVYGASLLLLRPDLHVFWRGERLPDADRLTAAATGFAQDRFGVPAPSPAMG
jgi:hypothetical protein